MLLNLPDIKKAYRREIKFYERYGKWAVMMSIRGEKHAAHLHVSQYGDDEYSAGLEMHWETPPSYRQGEPPDHENCPFVHGHCWHDGTSVGADQAKEAVIQGVYGLALLQLELFYVEGLRKVLDLDDL